MESEHSNEQHNLFKNLAQHLSGSVYVAVIVGSLLTIATDGFSRALVPFHLSSQGKYYLAFLSIALLGMEMSAPGKPVVYHRRLCMLIGIILSIQSIALNPRIYAVVHESVSKSGVMQL